MLGLSFTGFLALFIAISLLISGIQDIDNSTTTSTTSYDFTHNHNINDREMTLLKQLNISHNYLVNTENALILDTPDFYASEPNWSKPLNINNKHTNRKYINISETTQFAIYNNSYQETVSHYPSILSCGYITENDLSVWNMIINGDSQYGIVESFNYVSQSYTFISNSTGLFVLNSSSNTIYENLTIDESDSFLTNRIDILNNTHSRARFYVNESLIFSEIAELEETFDQNLNVSGNTLFSGQDVIPIAQSLTTDAIPTFSDFFANLTLSNVYLNTTSKAHSINMLTIARSISDFDISMNLSNSLYEITKIGSDFYFNQSAINLTSFGLSSGFTTYIESDSNISIAIRLFVEYYPKFRTSLLSESAIGGIMVFGVLIGISIPLVKKILESNLER